MKPARRLALNRERLTELTTAEMREVGGASGYGCPTSGYTCLCPTGYTCTCYVVTLDERCVAPGTLTDCFETCV